ncbi:MAG: hypothetical protein ACP5PS_04860 [Bacteroidales bacterium]
MDIAGVQQHIAQVLKDIESNTHPVLGQLIQQAYFNRHWYTAGEIFRRLQAIGRYIASADFMQHYGGLKPVSPCRVAFYAEENIPLEEFFSLITLLAMGHEVQYKGTSPSDKILKWIIGYLQQQGVWQGKITFVEEQFSPFDRLIIASRYPWSNGNRRLLHQKHVVLELIRYQSVAVISSLSSDSQLQNLAMDIFSYFGMGCGNVRKIYVPRDFEFDRFFRLIDNWYDLMFNHHTYMNNYQYYQSIYLMNRITHRDNGFILLKEDTQHRAPTGVLYYEYYDDEQATRRQLHQTREMYRVYVADPQMSKEISYGKSVNQLFLPQEEIIAFAR